MRPRLSQILVTGGAGFIGSEFVRQGVERGHNIVVADKLTYAGDLSRLRNVKKHIRFYKTDIGHKPALEKIFKKESIHAIVHFAAETHVDRSIHEDVTPFIDTNVKGTQNLIDLARAYHVKKFLHISTDEVYGQIERGQFFEDRSPLRPNNPYSATKAAAEFLIRAAVRTHQFPAMILRPSNNYGPWQYPEKFIPVVILKALKNQRVPVYGEGKQIREWLYVGDCINAVYLILQKGKTGEAYNIGSDFHNQNLSTARAILRRMKKPESLIEFVQDRPGHDFRYSVNCAKLKKLGWRPRVKFETGINHTAEWYTANFQWLKKKYIFLQSYWKKIYSSK